MGCEGFEVSSILAMLWGRTAAIIVGAVGLIAALFGIRYNIRKGAKDEVRAQMQEETMERIRRTRDIEGRGDLDCDSVLDKLREQGHLRE